MNIVRKTALLVLMSLCFTFCTNVYSASKADVERIFYKIKMESDFLSKLYAVVPEYAENGVTQASTDEKIKQITGNVLDRALNAKNAGTLTKDNFDQEMKKITVNTAATMEPVYIALCLKAFPESQDMAIRLLKNELPVEFEGLYQTIRQEAAYILDFEKRPYELIFSDMENHIWAEDAVYSLYQSGVIKGVSQNNFAPGDNVTREQFVKMLALLFDIRYDGEVQIKFDDVPEDAWFYPYVQAMAGSGLVKGISETAFGAGYDITRQDMAVLLFRICEQKGYLTAASSGHRFEDDNNISGYAKSAVLTLKEKNIVSGTPDNYYYPGNFATRAEAAQILNNCYKSVVTKALEL